MPPTQVTCFDNPLDLKLTSGALIPDVRVTADMASVKEFGGEDLRTPSVSPNNSFIEEHHKNTDVSPSLRDLEPGYVSNLAEFWAKKALRSVQQAAASVSVISEAGEQLLQEDSESVLEAASFIKLQEVLARQYEEYIRDLEEDRANLRKQVENLEAEKTSLDEEIQDWEQQMEAKSSRICQLKDSLSITNDKHSKLLREDLEKNYRIIEQEGTIEDLKIENEQLKAENSHLKNTVEALQSTSVSGVKEAVNQPNSKVCSKANPVIKAEDKNLMNEIAMLDQDVASLKEHLALNRTKRNRTTSTGMDQIEFFKMRTLKKLPKKRKIELKNSDPVRGDYVVETTFFPDTSTSSPERSILKEAAPSPRPGSFFKSLFRTSARSSRSISISSPRRIEKFEKHVKDCKQQ